VFRVRQFASDMLGGKGIAWQFQAPAEFQSVKLNPEQRRHVFLIFKEAINNSARHADCRSVNLGLSVAHNQIVPESRRYGRGFAASPMKDGRAGNGRSGHGLANIRTRAEQLGAHLSIDSSPGRGTRIRLEVPLREHGINMLWPGGGK